MASVHGQHKYHQLARISGNQAPAFRAARTVCTLVPRYIATFFIIRHCLTNYRDQLLMISSIFNVQVKIQCSIWFWFCRTPVFSLGIWNTMVTRRRKFFSKSPNCWQSVLSYDLNGLIFGSIHFKSWMINFRQPKISSIHVCTDFEFST